MRFEVTAKYAKAHDFDLISSTLGISRWKDMSQINGCGVRAADSFDGVTYWDFNWRKQGGSSRMLELSKQEEFYQQEYCGCVYSLRDTNRWRVSRGREKVERGVKLMQKKPVKMQIWLLLMFGRAWVKKMNKQSVNLPLKIFRNMLAACI
jgi:predicted adenine nucleotide alpha hydrolase (AANH) superfamily ATPase